MRGTSNDGRNECCGFDGPYSQVKRGTFFKKKREKRLPEEDSKMFRKCRQVASRNSH